MYDPSPAAYNASDPLANFDIAEILSQKAAAYGSSLDIADPLTRPLVRTRPPTGRTVFIADRLSPTTAPTPIVAVRVLERMCREQKVRNKFHSQKFHERKGLKRKRLRSERWRARFKVGFKAAVSKVMELKKQGW
ncbi:37S ribosomal protein mrp21 [Escovopsis weberi]|uniref:37S ribosomal protein mrp21 n=1 Tax=Escovopsis weberi TaxID=150374 RepID=A0A0M9VV08_ESCWE|nr:37S ribosomal protein mrp21 [Escovopsis weberi]